MSAFAPLFSKSWSVGKRTCRLDVPKAAPGQTLTVFLDWTPDAPARLTAAELVQYRKGRDAAIAAAAAELGIKIALVEI
jgi:hypothetical protein